MLVLSVSATLLVTNDVGLFNGPAGLRSSLSPVESASTRPRSTISGCTSGVTAVFCVVVYLFVHRVTSSPIGRTLRAIRDNEAAAPALGKDVMRMRLFIFVMGNVIAGISGAVLVQFIGAWSPGSWLYVETFVFFTAIIVGGTGNDAGVMLGALLVPVAFNERTPIPAPDRPSRADRCAAVDRDRAARARASSGSGLAESFPSAAAASRAGGRPTWPADGRARSRPYVPKAR